MPGYEAIDDRELAALTKIFTHGGGILFRHGFDAIRSGSYKVEEFETSFARELGTEAALAVSSGTAALRVALAALGVGPGDEVITQAFTFVATVEAIVESGAIPVITEIDSSLNMDPQDLVRKITPKTKAVIPVHMLGTPANMVEILEICDRHQLPIIEDTAWGCGGSLDGASLGSIGTIGCFSFDFAKTMTTGEGGMVISRSPELLAKAKAWHDHGHENNPALNRWEDSRASSGFNYRMTELQGAIGVVQLQKLKQVVSRQREVHDMYRELIRELPQLSVREEPSGSFSTCDAFVFSAETKAQAAAIRGALVDKGKSTKILPEAITWHFAGDWNHIDQLVNRYPGLATEFMQSREILERCVAIPISIRDSAESVKTVVDIIASMG